MFCSLQGKWNLLTLRKTDDCSLPLAQWQPFCSCASRPLWTVRSKDKKFAAIIVICESLLVLKAFSFFRSLFFLNMSLPYCLLKMWKYESVSPHKEPSQLFAASVAFSQECPTRNVKSISTLLFLVLWKYSNKIYILTLNLLTHQIPESRACSFGCLLFRKCLLAIHEQKWRWGWTAKDPFPTGKAKEKYPVANHRSERENNQYGPSFNSITNEKSMWK